MAGNCNSVQYQPQYTSGPTAGQPLATAAPPGVDPNSDAANPYSICMGEGTCNASGGPVGTAPLGTPPTPGATSVPPGGITSEAYTNPDGVTVVPDPNIPGGAYAANLPPGACNNEEGVNCLFAVSDFGTGYTDVPGHPGWMVPNAPSSSTGIPAMPGVNGPTPAVGVAPQTVAPAPTGPTPYGDPCQEPVLGQYCDHPALFPVAPLGAPGDPNVPLPATNVPQDAPQGDMDALTNPPSNGQIPPNSDQSAQNGTSDAGCTESWCDTTPTPIEPQSDADVFRNNMPPGTPIPAAMNRKSQVDPATGKCPNGDVPTATASCNYQFTPPTAAPAAQPIAPAAPACNPATDQFGCIPQKAPIYGGAAPLPGQVSIEDQQRAAQQQEQQQQHTNTAPVVTPCTNAPESFQCAEYNISHAATGG